jgi:hypothetical protein
MNFIIQRIEDVDPHCRRSVERVRRLMDSCDLYEVGTVGINLILDVMYLDIGDGDQAAAEAWIDALAAQLKRHAQTEATAREPPKDTPPSQIQAERAHP